MSGCQSTNSTESNQDDILPPSLSYEQGVKGPTGSIMTEGYASAVSRVFRYLATTYRC